MAATADKITDNGDALTQKSLSEHNKKPSKGNVSALAKYMTPFNTALSAFSLLILFNVIWALIFGDQMGGRPAAELEITWVRKTGNKPFIPDFNQPRNAKNDSAEMPRITASGSSKIIHLPTQIAEAKPESFATTGKLTRAPLEQIVQYTKYGKLPIIGPMGEKPSKLYARPAPKFDGRPRIAIMITGLGIHLQSTKRAIDTLPGEVSFGFTPYGTGLQDWINRSRENGHEAILQTPMEPFDYPDNDPGPSTLLAEGEASLNMNRFKWALSRITGYIGITNFMGAKFTSKERAVTPILKELKKRGLTYVENGTLHRSKVAQISGEIGLEYSNVDVIIDEKHTIESIENAFEKIEKVAATKGIAFAIGSSLPVTIEHVRDWANSLEAKGFQLVPVSAKIAYDNKIKPASIRGN